MQGKARPSQSNEERLPSQICPLRMSDGRTWYPPLPTHSIQVILVFFHRLDVPSLCWWGSKFKEVWQREAREEDSHAEFGFGKDDSLADESFAHFVMSPCVGKESELVDLSRDGSFWDVVFGEAVRSFVWKRGVPRAWSFARKSIVWANPVVAVDEPLVDGSCLKDAGLSELTFEFNFSGEVETFHLALGLGMPWFSVDGFDLQQHEPSFKSGGAAPVVGSPAISVVHEHLLRQSVLGERLPKAGFDAGPRFVWDGFKGKAKACVVVKDAEHRVGDRFGHAFEIGLKQGSTGVPFKAQSFRFGGGCGGHSQAFENVVSGSHGQLNSMFGSQQGAKLARAPFRVERLHVRKGFLNRLTGPSWDRFGRSAELGQPGDTHLLGPEHPLAPRWACHAEMAARLTERNSLIKHTTHKAATIIHCTQTPKGHALLTKQGGYYVLADLDTMCWHRTRSGGKSVSEANW